jgi:hypothetical protein
VTTGWPWARHAVQGVFAVRSVREADLRGADLSQLNLESVDVQGARWDAATRWPNDDYAERILTASDEISPGVWRISQDMSRVGTLTGA